MRNISAVPCLSALLFGLFATCAASGHDFACAREKLGEDFEAQFLREHRGVIVQVDVDPERYLSLAKHESKLSPIEHEALLEAAAARLYKAKRARLSGTRFSVHEDGLFGPGVVVFVTDMQDVCELSANPHVQKIEVNEVFHMTPLLFQPAAAPSAATR